MDEWLIEHLVCPRHRLSLRLQGGNLICQYGCSYPCVDGIAVMLLEESKKLPGVYYENKNMAKNPVIIPEGSKVDPFVQQAVAGTCGLMYRKMINRLNDYPIPELPLEEGKGEYFLDIGCNWGRWCIAAARKGYLPVGIDASLETIQASCRVARQLGVDARYVVADARYLPFAENSFDLVFSYSVLQHFEKQDVKMALSGISATLKPGGKAVIQMANALGARSILHQIKRGFRKPEAFEVRYWRLSELKKVFQDRLGTAALKVDGFFSLNPQLKNMGMLPLRYRAVILLSAFLKNLARKLGLLVNFADSVYVVSFKSKKGYK